MKRIHFLLLIGSLFTLVFPHAIFSQKDPNVIWIDKFDKPTNQTLTQGNWYTFTDSSGGGASKIQKSYYKDQTRKSNSLRFSYDLDKGKWEWQPYAGLSCDLSVQQIPAGPIKGVAYEFKGSKHSFIYRTSSVKDNAFYQINIPACKDWTTIIIPCSELSQPDWGKATTFNEQDVTGLSWQIVGKTHDTGKVAIDNVRFLREIKTDKFPKNAVVVFPQKNKKVETIYSKLLNEKREIWVSVPKDNDPFLAKSNYPVVYLLDANWQFSSVVNMINEMSHDSLCPKMIVVGIPNTDRFRDLSPTPFSGSIFGGPIWDSVKTGGGEVFTSFIEKELIPHIDSTYSTSPYRIFMGASLGGLLAINTLMNHPDLFNAYVACDPSMWWDQQRLMKQADKVLQDKNFSTKALYFSIANTLPPGMDTVQALKDTSEVTYHIRSIFQFKELLQKHAQSRLKWNSKYYPNYGHMNVPEISEIDALRYFFKDYKLTANLFDLSVNADSIIALHYDRLSKQMGYPVLPPESLIHSLGDYYVANNRFDKAELFYNMNAENFPNSDQSLHCLGLFYEKNGAKQKALECYRKELQIKDNPDIRKKVKRMSK